MNAMFGIDNLANIIRITLMGIINILKMVLDVDIRYVT